MSRTKFHALVIGKIVAKHLRFSFFKVSYNLKKGIKFIFPAKIAKMNLKIITFKFPANIAKTMNLKKPANSNFPPKLQNYESEKVEKVNKFKFSAKSSNV